MFYNGKAAEARSAEATLQEMQRRKPEALVTIPEEYHHEFTTIDSGFAA